MSETPPAAPDGDALPPRARARCPGLFRAPDPSGQPDAGPGAGHQGRRLPTHVPSARSHIVERKVGIVGSEVERRPARPGPCSDPCDTTASGGRVEACTQLRPVHQACSRPARAPGGCRGAQLLVDLLVAVHPAVGQGQHQGGRRRGVLQGYDSGVAGLATDFAVDGKVTAARPALAKVTTDLQAVAAGAGTGEVASRTTGRVQADGSRRSVRPALLRPHGAGPPGRRREDARAGLPRRRTRRPIASLPQATRRGRPGRCSSRGR